jgi:hypothetical protein
MSVLLEGLFQPIDTVVVMGHLVKVQIAQVDERIRGVGSAAACIGSPKDTKENLCTQDHRSMTLLLLENDILI